MEFTDWYDRFQSNTFFKCRDTLDVVVEIIKKYSKKYDLIKIEDKVLIRAFDNIVNYQRLLVAFDVEFQSAIIDKNPGNYIVSKDVLGNDVASFIREFGMMIFIKDDNLNWFYIGSVFVNFRDITEHGFKLPDCKYIHSLYTTVTDDNSEKMAKNDKYFVVANLLDPLLEFDYTKGYKEFLKLIKKIKNEITKNELFLIFINNATKDKVKNKFKELQQKDIFENEGDQYIKKEVYYLKGLLREIPFQVFGRSIKKTEYEKIFENQLNTYWNDKLVKSRIMSKTEEVEFINLVKLLLNKTYFVVKGKRDMEAFSNVNILLDVDKNVVTFPSFYDIEIFNSFSKYFYKNAQLETTYNGLVNTNIYKKHADELFSSIQFDDKKSHNPVIDSLYTIVVALVINMGLNHYFENIDSSLDKMGGNIYKNTYLYKYKKYKCKYLNSK